MKVATVVGARPQFIKAATVSREIRTNPRLSEKIIHTGQHFDSDMSDVFFEQMDIPRPDFQLGISAMSHGAMTGRMIEAIEEILINECPEWVLVYGDTNSTLAGALAAAKLHIPIAHVEAGLRSFNMRMPEEINRVLTDRVSNLLFCPTQQAVDNLKAEGFENLSSEMLKVGDVMQDAALFYRDRSLRPESFPIGRGEPFVLATVHRAENTDDPERLSEIIRALNDINAEIPVVLPLHPRTRSRLRSIETQAAMHMIEPVGYLEMIWLLQHATAVTTDSGGLQKEAYFFRKPCITLRDETEWVELVKIGANRLAGAVYTDIIRAFEAMKEISVTDDPSLYGGGRAAKLIVNRLA